MDDYTASKQTSNLFTVLLLLWLPFFSECLLWICYQELLLSNSTLFIHQLESSAPWSDWLLFGQHFVIRKAILHANRFPKKPDKWFLRNGFLGTTMKVAFVEPITLIPAERHLPTASGTAARGGSIMEMRPRKQSCSVGKFTSSQSKVNPRGNWEEDRFKWQKPAREEGSVRWLFITELTKYPAEIGERKPFIWHYYFKK